MRARLLTCTVSAVALAVATSAFAQAPAPAAPEQEVEEIIVTGSRIARRDFVSATPIVTSS